jgi:hypothetical protein
MKEPRYDESEQSERWVLKQADNAHCAALSRAGIDFRAHAVQPKEPRQ